MQSLIRRLNQLAYSGDTFVARWRTERLRAFQNLVRPPSRAKVIDLGGTLHMWGLLEHDYHVTLVNLPGSYSERDRETCPKGFELVEADACDLSGSFQDGSFDVAFSNSVIEHVGDAARQQAFANEVQRLAPAYWVQTPSDRFPIEAHTGIPFYWKLPKRTRLAMERRWYKKLPAWTEFIRTTTVLSQARMAELFPGSEVYVERKFGFEKSYARYRRA